MSVIVLVLVVLFVVAIARSALIIIQQSETAVIERLGSYHRTLEPGINLLVPFVDVAREVVWRYALDDARGKSRYVTNRVSRIDLRETVFDFPQQSVITRDNVPANISAILYFQVTDAKKAVYEIANLPDAIEKLTQTSLRNVIGEMDLDETLTSRDIINSKLKAILDQATMKWGVKVNRVELQEVSPPAEIKGAMEKQMRAERDRRASILEAEGQKASRILESEGIRESQVNQAEGDKRARILAAEAEAEARLKVAEAEAQAIQRLAMQIQAIGGDATQYLVAMRYLDTLREMVSGQGNKVVYLPYEASALMTSLSALGSAFGGGAPLRDGQA
ncbi:MAG: stomatin-like protein [bacterium]|nr:stomatin-like protein [bacterium]